MRVGDIIVNPWVMKNFNGELNPNYATVYIGNNESIDYRGRKCRWAEKVYEEDPDSLRPWEVIGHIDISGIIENAIREAVGE